MRAVVVPPPARARPRAADTASASITIADVANSIAEKPNNLKKPGIKIPPFQYYPYYYDIKTVIKIMKIQLCVLCPTLFVGPNHQITFTI
jgi:hypothetical protein